MIQKKNGALKLELHCCLYNNHYTSSIPPQVYVILLVIVTVSLVLPTFIVNVAVSPSVPLVVTLIVFVLSSYEIYSLTLNLSLLISYVPRLL